MMLTHCTILYLRSRRHKMHLFSVLRVVMGCTRGGGVTLRNLAFTRTVDLRAMSEEEGGKESLTSEQKHTRQKKDSEGPQSSASQAWMAMLTLITPRKLDSPSASWSHSLIYSSS